jgi:LytS/YehU family sensor histidine kinase
MLASVPEPFATLTHAAIRRSPLLYALAAMWLLVWMLLALVEVASLLHHPRVPLWRPLTLVFISTAVVGGWLAWAVATRRFEKVPLDSPARWFRYHLRVLPLLIVIAIPLILGLNQVFYKVIGTDYGYVTPHFKTLFDALKISLFYGLWLAVMFGLLTMERMLGVQKALAEAQLAQLQAQLRPHFLFNALNTVSSLMQTDTARADRVLSQLGDLLRVSLSSSRPELVPLREELKILRKYVDIMQERFEERAVVSWDVAENALDAPLPSMLIQPLLENAYKHGVERNTQAVSISIVARRVDDSLWVKIQNSGSTLASASEPGTGVGLHNCRERLRLIYGETATLVVEDDTTGGVRAVVTVPCPAPAA